MHFTTSAKNGILIISLIVEVVFIGISCAEESSNETMVLKIELDTQPIDN